MKYLYIPTLILAVFLISYISISHGNIDGPHLRIDKPRLDLGQLPQYTRIKKTITIRNSGNEDLVLNNPKGSCQCVRSLPETITLRPGAHTKIPVEFNTGGSVGQQSKHISMNTNDPHNPVLHVTLEAEIIDRIKHFPTTLDFSISGADNSENDIRKVYISSHKIEYSVVDAKIDSSNIELEDISLISKKPKVYSITVRILDKTHKDKEANLEIMLDQKIQSTISVPVLW